MRSGWVCVCVLWLLCFVVTFSKVIISKRKLTSDFGGFFGGCFLSMSSFCVQHDGTVMVWDLREPSSLHRSVFMDGQEITMRSPTYNTGNNVPTYNTGNTIPTYNTDNTVPTYNPDNTIPTYNTGNTAPTTTQVTLSPPTAQVTLSPPTTQVTVPTTTQVTVPTTTQVTLSPPTTQVTLCTLQHR